LEYREGIEMVYLADIRNDPEATRKVIGRYQSIGAADAHLEHMRRCYGIGAARRQEGNLYCVTVLQKKTVNGNIIYQDYS